MILQIINAAAEWEKIGVTTVDKDHKQTAKTKTDFPPNFCAAQAPMIFHNKKYVHKYTQILLLTYEINKFNYIRKIIFHFNFTT